MPAAPPRPQGLERNLVLTMWEWGGPTGYVHDEVSTDKRNPTVNANGMVYGAMYGKDGLAMVDLVESTANMVHVPTRDPNVPAEFSQTMPAPSPVWGDEIRLEQSGQRSQSHDGSEGARMDRPLGSAKTRTNRLFAKKARITHLRKCILWIEAAASYPSTIRRRGR